MRDINVDRSYMSNSAVRWTDHAAVRSKCFCLRASKSLVLRVDSKMVKTYLPNQLDRYEEPHPFSRGEIYEVSGWNCRSQTRRAHFQAAEFCLCFHQERNPTRSEFLSSQRARQACLNFKTYWFGISYRCGPITVSIADRRFDKMSGKHFTIDLKFLRGHDRSPASHCNYHTQLCVIRCAPTPPPPPPPPPFASTLINT